MKNKNTSNIFNNFSCFEDSILAIAKNELKESVSEKTVSQGHKKKGHELGASNEGTFSELGKGVSGQIAIGIGDLLLPLIIASGVAGALASCQSFDRLTDVYYSEELEKRYRDYIKKNYELEFNQHKNDVPYVLNLIARAVKAVKKLMSTPSNTPSPNMEAPVGIAVEKNKADSDNNENNCE